LIIGGVFNFSILIFSLLLCLVCHFSCLFVGLAVLLLLDDLFELFFDFWLSSCASWGLGFELQTLCLCCQWTHQGGD
jgi:hypothetical protein